MNISLIQPKLSIAERANNLMMLGSMIRREARHTPAPDLVILPDCCVATQETDRQSQVTAAMCQGFAEAFASWAREWGIWIAVGHSIVTEAGLEEFATLFDPDGDPFIRAKDPTETTNPSSAWQVRNSPIGRIALCSWNKPTMDGCPPIETTIPPDLVVIPAISPNRAAIETMAKRHSAYAAFVGCVLDQSDQEVVSYCADRSGKIIAETTPGIATSTFVTVDIEPCNTTDDPWEASELLE